MFPRLTLSISIAIMLITCNAYGRNFYLSPVAWSPSSIGMLKERWFFCEKCLHDKKCQINDVKQCNAITLPDRSEALGAAVERNNTEAVNFLVNIAKTDVNEPIGDYKETPLMIAAYYGSEGHQNIASFLISHGANVNAIKNSSPTSTALLTAIWKNNKNFAKFLIENGANPSLTANGEKYGYACRYALAGGNVDFIPIIPGCCNLIKNDSMNIFLEQCH
ncbi:TPA: ankyrin repeat domain-containing protein [Escherichia coli]|nr:ankyrin repeat domain-containing protein [Escherichia coli]